MTDVTQLTSPQGGPAIGDLYLTYRPGTGGGSGTLYWASAPSSLAAGLSTAIINGAGHLIVTRTDGTTLDAGALPVPLPGVGIERGTINGSGHLVLVKTDGTTSDAGLLPVGAPATITYGTTAGTAMQGNDSRVVNAASASDLAALTAQVAAMAAQLAALQAGSGSGGSPSAPNFASTSTTMDSTTKTFDQQ